MLSSPFLMMDPPFLAPVFSASGRGVKGWKGAMSLPCVMGRHWVGVNRADVNGATGDVKSLQFIDLSVTSCKALNQRIIE